MSMSMLPTTTFKLWSQTKNKEFVIVTMKWKPLLETWTNNRNVAKAWGLCTNITTSIKKSHESICNKGFYVFGNK